MVRLFFVFATGCPACKAAKPELEKFHRMHPEISVHMVDLTETEWPRNAKYQPEAIPSYILHQPKDRIMVKEGTMSSNELDAWIRKKMLPGAFDVEEGE